MQADGMTSPVPVSEALRQLLSADTVTDQSFCGLADAPPCTGELEQPCACGLVADEERNLCVFSNSPGPCPVRPYCGYDGAVPCAFPGDQACDPGLDVDEANAICVAIGAPPILTAGRMQTTTVLVCRCLGLLLRQIGAVLHSCCPGLPPSCMYTVVPCACSHTGRAVAEEEVADQSFGGCEDRTVPDEDGSCIPCGSAAFEPVCMTEPRCEGRLVPSVVGIESDTCVPCGGVDQPPCSDRAVDQPCDEGLVRASVQIVDGVRAKADGDESLCVAEVPEGQCGFVGQEACEGTCKGRSAVSEDGQTCEDCGAEGEPVCNNGSGCDALLTETEQDGLRSVCLCAAGAGLCDPAAPAEEEPAVVCEEGFVADPTGACVPAALSSCWRQIALLLFGTVRCGESEAVVARAGVWSGAAKKPSRPGTTWLKCMLPCLIGRMPCLPRA